MLQKYAILLGAWLFVAAMAWFARQLVWWLLCGSHLKPRAWQQYLARHIQPLLTRCFRAYGEPLLVAADHAAAAAADLAKGLTKYR